jgi:hypothetical protein
MVTSARRHSVTCISYLIISDRTLERDLSNASIIAAKSTHKWEIAISITYRVKIEKVIIYFIVEKSELNWSNFEIIDFKIKLAKVY